MTTLARDVPVHSLQRKRRLRMRPQPDLRRKPSPANAGMAVLTPISELRLVHLRMAGDALGARTGRHDVPLVVTGLALRLAVTRGEAQDRMILPDVVDLAPIGFVVTGDAFGACKRALVRILVTGQAVGLQSEIRSVAAAVLPVMTVPASNRTVSAFERPTRLAMIEALRPAARPADEPRIPSEVLDVTATAVLPAILASMKARLPPYLDAQVVVAPKAGVRIDPFARRVAFAAIRITIDVGVGVGQLPWGQKLGAGWAGHQRSGHRRCYHQAADDHQGGDAPPHYSEKIHRYP